MIRYVSLVTVLLTTSCASSTVYLSDICTKNLKIVKLVEPERQPRHTKEDLLYNNTIIEQSNCPKKKGTP